MAETLDSSITLFSCLQFNCDPESHLGRSLKFSLLQSSGRCFSSWSATSSFGSGQYSRSGVFPGKLLFILAPIPSNFVNAFHSHLGHLFQRCAIHPSVGIIECGVNGGFDKSGSTATVIELTVRTAWPVGTFFRFWYSLFHLGSIRKSMVHLANCKCNLPDISLPIGDCLGWLESFFLQWSCDCSCSCNEELFVSGWSMASLLFMV